MLYITFFLVMIIIVVVAAVLAPMGVLFNSKMYAAGQDLLLRANSTISDINDTTVRTSIYASIGAAQESAQTNIDVNADIFQYSWVFAIMLGALIVFMFTRRTVEVGGGGFV